jgi:hypothetical protein
MLFLSLLRLNLLPPTAGIGLQRLLFVVEYLVSLGIPLLGMYWLTNTLLELAESRFPGFDFTPSAYIFLVVTVFLTFKIVLEKVIRYRIAPMFTTKLNFSKEEIQAEHLTITKGMPVVEILMGERYEYLFRYRHMKLSPKELTVFLYLDTYKGLLKFLEKIKSGWWLIPKTSIIMIYTPLLKEEYARRIRAVSSLKVVSQEELRKKRLFHYRLTMFMATGLNPFSKNVPIPKFYRRGYFKAESLLAEDLEPDLRAEIARLSVLVEGILAKKKKKPSSAL